MCQASAERKESLEKVWYFVVIHEWTESHRENGNNDGAQFEKICPANKTDCIVEKALFGVILKVQSVRTQQEDKHGRRQVQIDVLEAKKYTEPEAAPQELLLARIGNHQHKKPIHHAVVLEMNMIDYK